ncbi:hypothetical protein J1605_007971 [Eschrichtius robustus]|uniref:Coiled-coil domain-containing protein n=1 Tax=Eschrichtius robustus TaxID=9764 RepID=A0AB34H1R0_ESCRO|nr:hypothetical protein J1605_007971 [Eschrichtius robustus]
MKGRKLKDLSSFSNVKTVCLLKKSAALTIVLPEDSEDSELEEEVEMDEVECLLEEVRQQGPLISSKERSYQKAGSIIRMPLECFVPPQLVWPTRNKYKLLQARGEYERIPVACQLKRQDDCESTRGRLRSKQAMAKLEGLQCRRASHKSLESL